MMTLPIFQPSSRPVKRVAIAAGKGGVGKSTVAAALAVALRNRGLCVGLLDADVYGPSIAQMLPDDDPPRLEGERLVPALSSGIRLISMAHFRPQWQSMGLRAPMANGVVGRFLSQVEWGDLDYLMIDFPPGTGDIQLTLCQEAALSGALLVTTPQEIALGDVRRAVHLFRQMEVPILGLVENMSYLSVGEERVRPFGEGGGRRLSQELEIPFLGEIPLDETLCRQCDEGEVSRWSPERSPFVRLAEQVAGWFGGAEEVPEVEPAGPHHLSIRWPDGVEGALRLSRVQERCPCACCLEGGAEVDPDVRARALHLVGRYGLRFDFMTGCSYGIYPYSMLREMV